MTDYRGRVLGGVAVSGRIARLVLLACTLFGLAAMHTIGHGGGGHAAHHDEPRAAAVGMALTVGDTASDGCECDHTATQPIGSSGMSGWGLCVAVLGALAVAVLLAALLLGAVTGRHPLRTARGPCRRAPRAPPVLPFGLTLATVSVLRT
ncbi:hypothetical protein DMB66_50685 [Actinoplanes sp. ATCC 53533]|uniref:DUF6153 family protein n=1 Tax=Actinoplanes sp. ATCC 53533 TaxID=1288362 RepID=UPI000F79D9CA|nr:DUF6153 family protein [Actinoplanes sp. ATCC 53533]RSM45643.1 hypothetical protein DMB66_50685 [Actinoplanes sp. ATCC 53533]